MSGMSGMGKLSGACAVTGVGETVYCQGTTRSPMSLSMEAAMLAIEDAGLKPRDIDGVIPMVRAAAIAEDYIANLGIPDLKYSAYTPLGGASCVAALQTAVLAIGSGLCRHVLIPAGRTGYTGARTASRLGVSPPFNIVKEFEFPLGAVAPVHFYAQIARRHMELYGTSAEDFAEVAMSARRHAMLNPNALMKQPMSLQDHQTARMIADPFRLLDCCIESDGGAAIVVSSAEAAADAPHHRVRIIGCAEGHPDSPASVTQREEMTVIGVKKAAPRAFSMADVKPADVDFACLYDCFTFVVLCQLEDLGFCAKGEGGHFVRGGTIALGGKLPVNPHGGLLSQAHLSGMNHICETVRQLRHQADARQVQGAQVGLVTGWGDHGDGSVAILRRD